MKWDQICYRFVTNLIFYFFDKPKCKHSTFVHSNIRILKTTLKIPMHALLHTVLCILSVTVAGTGLLRRRASALKSIDPWFKSHRTPGFQAQLIHN